MGMGTAALIPAILFGLVGLFIILYCLKILMGNLVKGLDLGALLERRRFVHKQQQLAAARQRFAHDEFERGLALLRDAFFFDLVKHDLQLIDRVQDHHLSILQELLAATQRRGVHMLNLPLVEELLQTRANALRAYCETRIAARALGKKGKGGRTQAPPAWALAEFSRKLEEQKEKTAVARRSLERELDILFKTARSTERSSGVMYH